MQDEAARLFRDSPGALIGHDTASPVDVGWILDNADWPKIFRSCWRAVYCGRWNPDEFGVVPEKEEFFTVSLELSLTPEDWSALLRKCRNGFGKSGTRLIPYLHGNHLFFIWDGVGDCHAIFRIANLDGQYMVRELYLNNVEQDDPGFSIASVVDMLAKMLPGHRYGLRDKKDEESWYWREPDESGYKRRRPYPWSAIDPDINLTNFRFELMDWGSQQGGENAVRPLEFSNDDLRILCNDPNLCCEGAPSAFWYQAPGHFDEGRLYIWGYGGVRYAVFFDEVKDGYRCSRTLVNRNNNDLQMEWADAAYVAEDIMTVIGELLAKKRAWYAKQRRWHKAMILPPLSQSTV